MKDMELRTVFSASWYTDSIDECISYTRVVLITLNILFVYNIDYLIRISVLTKYQRLNISHFYT